MRNIFTLILLASILVASAQNVVVNTNNYSDIITSNSGNTLFLSTDMNIEYSFIFNKREISVIKNFTGDIITDTYEVESYKVIAGNVIFNTDIATITLDMDNNTIMVKNTKDNNKYTCYYLEDNEIGNEISEITNF